MIFLVSSLYASLLSVILIYLSARVVRLRMGHKVSLGHKESKALHVAMRVQANFVEYVPLCLILLLLFEFNFGSSWYVHALGISLVFARVLHAYGFITANGGVSSARALGLALTLLVLLLLSVLNALFFIGELIT